MDWMPDWERTSARHAAWWRGEGLVVHAGSFAQPVAREGVPEPPAAPTVRAAYEDGAARAARNHAWLARQRFYGETLAISDTNIGPGSLALFLGSEPGFSPETVWFEPCMADVEAPEALPPPRFDPACHWWRVTEETCRAAAALGAGRYLTGFPDLVENVDILAALRDPQTLMVDFIERPEWVEQKVWEINVAFREAYDRLYAIIRQPDGGSCFSAFALWGPGRTAKVQCDAAAMFSPAMFTRFVVPALREQCAWLDQSMFHLDGTQCLDKLDLLLAIKELDAIEWTPQSGIEGGGDPRWFEVYRRIRAAGKSVQALGVHLAEMAPLLDAVGPEGLNIVAWPTSESEAEAIVAVTDRYR